MSHAIRESGKVKVVEECEDTETVVNSSENGDTEPSRSKKDTEKGPEGASDAAPADSGRKDRSEDPDEPGTPPKASEPSSWCLHYELTRDLKKAFMAHISEMDDQRALAQDLRYECRTIESFISGRQGCFGTPCRDITCLMRCTDACNPCWTQVSRVPPGL